MTVSLRNSLTLNGYPENLFLFAFLFLSPYVIRATDTQATSAAEAQELINAAEPGETIVVSNCEYTDFEVVIKNSGTADLPITLKAESGGKVRLKGRSGFQIKGSHVIVDGFIFDSVGSMTTNDNVIVFEGATFSKLTNCAFYRCGQSKWVHIIKLDGGSRNCEVSYCYLEDIIGQGIGVIGSANNVGNHLHHNHINRTISDGESNGQEPIQVGQNQRTQGRNYNNTLVEYNLIENMHGDADPELISNKTAGNVYRFNTFLNNRKGTNLTVRGGNDCSIENNYFVGSGIRVYGTGHRIRYNRIKNSPEGILFPGGTGTSPDESYNETVNCLAEYNLITGTTENAFRVGGGNPGGIEVRDLVIRGNRVRSNTGTQYFLHPGNRGGILWCGNIGEGEAVLKSKTIESGVEFGRIEAYEPSQPLQYEEVGPQWRRPAGLRELSPQF